MILEFVIQTQECIGDFGVRNLHGGTRCAVFVMVPARPEQFCVVAFDFECDTAVGAVDFAVHRVI